MRQQKAGYHEESLEGAKAVLDRMVKILKNPAGTYAEILDVSPNTIKTWLHRGEVPLKYIQGFAKNHNLSVDYVLRGNEGSEVSEAVQIETPHTRKRPTAREPMSPSCPDGFILVPRYNVTGSMGNGHVIHSEQVVDHLAFRAEWVRTELGASPNNLVLISAVGDSMEPTLRAYDLLLIDRSVLSVKQDSIYAFAVDGELRVKRIQRLFDGSLIIKSDNPGYAMETLTPAQSEMINIIGRVVWSGRRM